MTEHDQYPISVFWSDEDRGYIAIAPDLPGFSTFGETAENALREIRAAIPAWVDSISSVGNIVPKSSKYNPEQQYSGKVLVRMPRTLHAQLVERAKRENVSLNQCISFLLAEGVSTAPMKAPLPQLEAKTVLWEEGVVRYAHSQYTKLFIMGYNSVMGIRSSSVSRDGVCTGNADRQRQPLVMTSQGNSNGNELWPQQTSIASH